jgi:hypothetical protein
MGYKDLLLRSTICSFEPEAKNALAKIRHISRIAPIELIRFSYWREYAPRIETKRSDATTKKAGESAGLFELRYYRFFRRLLQVHLVLVERRGKPTYRFPRAPRQRRWV